MKDLSFEMRVRTLVTLPFVVLLIGVTVILSYILGVIDLIFGTHMLDSIMKWMDKRG